jgi:hypothetical protein
VEEWEYQRLSVGNEMGGPSEVAALDKLGRDGWELVSSFYSGTTTFHYLKRRRRPEGSAGPYR